MIEITESEYRRLLPKGITFYSYGTTYLIVDGILLVLAPTVTEYADGIQTESSN